MSTAAATARALQSIPSREWTRIAGITTGIRERNEEKKAARLHFSSTKDAEDAVILIRNQNILCLYDRIYNPVSVTILMENYKEVDRLLSERFLVYEEG